MQMAVHDNEAARAPTCLLLISMPMLRRQQRRLAEKKKAKKCQNLLTAAIRLLALGPLVVTEDVQTACESESGVYAAGKLPLYVSTCATLRTLIC